MSKKKAAPKGKPQAKKNTKRSAPVKVPTKKVSNNPDGRPSKRPPTAKSLRCGQCKKRKTISHYRLRSGTPNMNSYCNECLAANSKKYAAKRG